MGKFTYEASGQAHNDDVIGSGILLVDEETGQVQVGDGETAVNDLPVFVGSGGTPITETADFNLEARHANRTVIVTSAEEETRAITCIESAAQEEDTYPVGATTRIVQGGADSVEVQGTEGSTLIYNSYWDPQLQGQGSVAFVTKIDDESYVVYGDLVVD